MGLLHTNYILPVIIRGYDFSFQTQNHPTLTASATQLKAIRDYTFVKAIIATAVALRTELGQTLIVDTN